MLADRTTISYRLLVKNKAGELAKVTKCLSDAGVNVSGLLVANLGDEAAIQFSIPKDSVLPPALRGLRIDPNLDF
jgi:hypothetical protein